MDHANHHMPAPDSAKVSTSGIITEFAINWPYGDKMSTHELVIKEEYIYITGQKNNMLARFVMKTRLFDFFCLAKGIIEPDISAAAGGNGPHGLLIDGKGNVWVSLEFKGTVARLSDDGQIVEEIDVRIYGNGIQSFINPAPHGIGLDADGETIWFTGKRTSTIGRINPDRTVQHFPLNNLSAMPIFLSSGIGSGIWGTELFQSSILNVSADGVVKEYAIPTAGSRPIAVIPDPQGSYMWFTEEAGMKIGRIDAHGTITEFAIPSLQRNDILGSLCFDAHYNLWVQVYADYNNPVASGYNPPNYDYLIQIDKMIRDLPGNDLSGVPFTTHSTPSKNTMLHRIKADNMGNLWFTEMMTDRLGLVSANH